MVAWKTQRVPFIQNPEHAEALAVNAAAHFARHLRLEKVLFEGDNINVIKHMQQQTTSFTDYGHIIEDTKLLLSSFTTVSFCYVNRLGNKVAHTLAHDFVLDI